jgi:hypothetical protein
MRVSIGVNRDRLESAKEAFLGLLRIHWLVILVALIAGSSVVIGYKVEYMRVTYLMPELIGSRWSSIAVGERSSRQIDEMTRLAQGQYFADGHWATALSDPYLWEYRDSPTSAPILTVASIAAAIRVFGGAENAYVVLRILSYILVVLGIYALFYCATRDRLYALAAAAATLALDGLGGILARPASLNTYSLLASVFGTFGSGLSRNFSRVPYSAFTFPLLLLCIIAYSRLLNEPDLRKSIYAGLALGLQPLIYPVYSTSWGAGLVVLTVGLLVMRKFGHLKYLVVSGLVAVFVALPSLITQYRVMKSPFYTDMVARMSMGPGQFDPQMMVLLAVVAVIYCAAVFFLPDQVKPAFTTLAVLITGATLCLNLHLLTGVDLQRWHWRVRIVQPLMVPFILTALYPLWMKFVHRVDHYSELSIAPKGVLVAIVAASLTMVAMHEIGGAWLRKPGRISLDEERAWEWLSAPTRREGTVLSIDPTVIYNSRVLGHSRSFLPVAWASAAPSAELLDRWTSAFWLYGARSSFVDTLLRVSQPAPEWDYQVRVTFSTLIHRHYSTGFATKNLIPEPEIARILAGVADSSDPTGALTKYRIDYIWQGPYERSIGMGDLAGRPGIRRVVTFGDISLFMLAKGDTTRSGDSER